MVSFYALLRLSFKRVISLVCFFVFMLASIAAQTTRIVCNSSGYNKGEASTVFYKDLQVCLDASNKGDIIYVQSSGTSYGNITIKQPVVLIGPGYLLGQNSAPNTQALTASATLGNVEIEAAGSNSIIKGFVTGYIAVRGASSIIIQDNYTTNHIHLKNAGNCTIKNNMAVHLFAYYGEWVNNSGIIVQNNILSGGCYVQNGVVTNNVIDSDFSDDGSNFISCGVKNNIFGNNFGDLNGYPQCGFINNVFRNAVPNAGNNVINADPNSLFVGYPIQGEYSSDGRFQLKPDSPAKGAGEGGTDCGLFGGDEPYKPSGIGFNPNIFKIEMGTSGTSGGGLPVRIQVAANQ